jgi:hypothetical protein
MPQQHDQFSDGQMALIEIVATRAAKAALREANIEKVVNEYR